MDNQWQPSKCGSICHSSAEPAVVAAPSPVSQVQSQDSSRNSMMMNPSHYYYPNIVQEPNSSTRKTITDPLFQATNINLYNNSNLSVIGTSFFTLLSGPPASFSKYDSQQLLTSKPPNPSTKVQVYNSNSIVGPTQCEPSFDNRYLKSKIDVCEVSNGGNTSSCLHDIMQGRKVNYQTSHVIQQVNAFSSLKTTHQLSPISSGLPRVFCLYASGDLFFTSSGLLGVVCSCHGFRMSISKFSEHSGLQDVNPGDAVHTDNGETISQWRKGYFGKFGIRIPEEQHGWHWPQGFSPPADVAKSSDMASNMSTSSHLSKSIAPSRPLNNMVFQETHHSNQNSVNNLVCHEVQRNNHDNNTELPNGGPASKIMEQFVSGCISIPNAFQSTPTFINQIYKTKTSFTSQNSLQSIRIISKDSDKKFKNSNIELRLGQPSQQSNPPGFHTPHVHPKLYNESKQVVDCAAQAAKSSLTEGQNRMKFSNLGFGAYSTIVTNPHTPLSRQNFKILNQDDVSSSCGFGKDQIVPGNSLNQNLRSSLTLPSKLTGKRDEYKHSIPETSFQIREIGMHSNNHLFNSYENGPTKSRIGVSENIHSSNCCQGTTTPCAYAQEKCNCCVQRNTSNLEKNNSVTTFNNTSGKIGETMKPNLKKVEFNTFQWKDVPSKMSERCHVRKLDQKDKFLEDTIHTNTIDVIDQSFDQTPVEKTDCMKEQVMSNISSKCSTQASVKISNGDSCTDEEHDTFCVKNFAVDESSGIKKSSSSSDDDDSDCKINLKNGKTRSLIDELRVIDSLRVKKVHENTSSMKSFEKDFEFKKRKRETKFKILASSHVSSSLSTGSSGQSSQSLEDFHKSLESKRVYNEIREGKKKKLDFDFSKRKPCKRIIKPVVCGRYGLISNGDTSKPAKIFSLGKILKTSKRLEPSRNKVIKNSPVLKKSRNTEGNRRSSRISNLKDDNNYYINEDPIETSKDTDSDDFCNKTRKKSKEVRIRSIYDLITKGKDSDIATISKDNLKEKSTQDVDKFCHVCGGVNNDEMNCLLECNKCLIKVHQACYGISKVPKSHWCCRPCKENVTNIVCVLCGYESGVMTRAIHTTDIVRTLLNAWNVIPESQKKTILPSSMVLNSVTSGFFDNSVKQWVHMVCGLWTPGTRCPNVDTMSTFDVSGASNPEGDPVCSMCKRGGGCCIRCRVIDCVVHFHPWCAHQKGLLQSEVEGVDNESVGFYGRCELHATNSYFNHKINSQSIQVFNENDTCTRTEGYKGRKREGFRHDSKQNPKCVVRQEQVDAWNYINQKLSFKKQIQKTTQPVQDIESDPRKEYGRYKQSKGWKHLVVYKSGIHALGLYTSMFISQSEMVVEYVGEIVGLRVADRRESEYESGKQLQYKSACYFFRIDKEYIIDATRKGGIARFVNHSCQPNCVAKVISVRGEKKVVFFAERDIYPGEEITYDYHFNNEDEGKKILCSCNSSNCRRFLN